MASDWLNALDDKERSREREQQTAELEAVVEHDPVEDESVGRAPVVTKTLDKSTRVTGGVLLGVVAVTVVGLGSYFAFAGDSDDTGVVADASDAGSPAEAASQNVQQSVGPETTVAAAPETSAAALGNKCEDAGLDPAGEESIRGAVATFETAYFDRNSDALIDSLSEDSPLREQDWDKVLNEVAPDGTTWCAELAPVEQGATSVDVDLEMKTPGGKAETYTQTIHGDKTASGWVVTSVEARG